MAPSTHEAQSFTLGQSPDDPLLGWLGIDVQSEIAHRTHMWARGDGNETVSVRGGGNWGVVSTEVVLKDVKAGQVSFQRTAEGVTLVIAPSTPGGKDGGSLALTNFNPRQGLESVVLDDATWTARQLAAKVLAAQATTGKDTITGFAIADVLAGGAGDDLLVGLRGNDTYKWSRGDGNDTIDETGRNGGRADKLVLDAVNAADVSVKISGQDVILTIGGTGGGTITLLGMDPVGQRGIESVQLADATWTANELRNMALAAAATTGNDAISGFTGNDTLIGGAGNNTLTGRGGTDRFEGGTDDDSFIVSSASDTIVEKAGEGTDTVFAAMSFTLAENVENLVITGTAASNGKGNALDNSLTGNAARNTLEGGDGNDILDGGAGADHLNGGAGDDSYIVDSSRDEVVEAKSAGTDTVYASVSHKLSANVENIVLTGTEALNGTGNKLANSLTGNAAANTLDGRGGNDLLTGGGGDDTFVFTGLFGSDTVTDFQSGNGAGDLLQLSLGTDFDSFAEVIAAAHEVDRNTVLDFGTHGTITLDGVSLSKLAADDFLFG